MERIVRVIVVRFVGDGGVGAEADARLLPGGGVRLGEGGGMIKISTPPPREGGS